MARALALSVVAHGLLPGVARGQGGDFEVAEGFWVERVSTTGPSILSLAFDESEHLFIGTESGGVRLLVDADGDGFYEEAAPWIEGLRGCQGLAAGAGTLFAVGVGPLGDGEEGPGLFRIEARGDREPRALLRFTDAGEHGPHGVAIGPEGFLYVTVGDAASIESDPAIPAVGYEGDVLETLHDPNGFGVACRFPNGFVARVDPSSGTWTYHSVGYRNAYDLAFDRTGELFTVDSDMEWDVGLPWYRPVRLLHASAGADFGRRSGSANGSDAYVDFTPAIAELGRGSPTGVAVYDHEAFPASFRGAILVGDWSRGRILAIRLERDGAGFRAAPFEPGGDVPFELVTARRPLNVTDLEVGPDGALYFSTGGRGTAGGVFRVEYRGEQEAEARRGDVLPAEHLLSWPQPTSPWGRRALEARLAEVGTDWAPTMLRFVQSLERSAGQRCAALRFLARHGSPPRPALLLSLARDREPRVRECAVTLLGTLGGKSRQAVLVAASTDSDAGVRRAAALAIGELPAVPPLSRALFHALGDEDRWVRLAARAALERPGWPGWPGWSGAGTRPEVATPRGRIEELLLETRARAEGFDFEAAVNLLGGPLRAHERRDLLRVIGIALSRGSTLAPAEAATLGELLAEGFPCGDALTDRLSAALLVRAAPARAVAELVPAQQEELDRAQTIYYALCLGQASEGWSLELRATFLAWFEEAAAWTGGGSFTGYVHEMLLGAVRRLDSDEALELAGRPQGFGPRTLAAWISIGDPAAAGSLLPDLRAAYTALDEDDPATFELRRGVLDSLRATRLEDLPDWYREIISEEPRQRDTALGALADYPVSAADFLLFVRGLTRPGGAALESSAQALLRMDPELATPETIRVVLRSAQRVDPRRGERLLSVLAHWTGRDRGWSEDSGAPLERSTFDAALSGWQEWFGETHPDLASLSSRDSGPPRWSFEALETFLSRSRKRPGSAARGAEVFSRAGCSACHVLRAQPAGQHPFVGPDLTTVARRFSETELLEAIHAPSRFVSDLYRTTLVLTDEGRSFEGRLVEDAPEHVTLLAVDGRRMNFPRREIVSVRSTEISLMPEGQLDALTLEEIKDLFCYLSAEGEVEPDEAREPTWAPLLGGVHGGFEPAGAAWRLVDGVLVGRGRSFEENRYLMTRDSFSNFEIEFDVRVSRGGNSGLQYRSEQRADYSDPVGYQADIGQTHWGSLFATDGRGLLAAPRAALRRKAVDREGWNHFFVRADGDQHVIEVNGLVTVRLRDDAHAEGRLGFQLHAGGRMRVEIANARLRRLE